MTNWRDTPSNVGFLIAAISDGKVAANHADLTVKSANSLDDMKLHAGHVLNALDTSVEPRGPGSGYGVKKAVGGAVQHLELAIQAEGASENIRTLAMPVKAALSTVARSTDQAVETAQKIRTVSNANEASALANELAGLTKNISDGLQQAKTGMDAIMKAEGLENAPR
jgi:methyl-accepting chemotaxis protein